MGGSRVRWDFVYFFFFIYFDNVYGFSILRGMPYYTRILMP